MSSSNYSFDKIDFVTITKNNILNNQCENIEENIEKIKYDKTTSETYRIKRIFKIDPLTDQEIPINLLFEFTYLWDPYTGIRKHIDPIGPLCFNAIELYNYFYINRYKGLWNPPSDQYQGYYGDFIGTGKIIKIKSRGANPEKYLFRLPIIDCYLFTNHKFSTITMGPELTDNEISQIDSIILKLHPNRSINNFVSLTKLKYYYDNALIQIPDPNCDEMIKLKEKFPNLENNQINEKYNRLWVDKLVKLKY